MGILSLRQDRTPRTKREWERGSTQSENKQIGEVRWERTKASRHNNPKKTEESVQHTKTGQKARSKVNGIRTKKTKSVKPPFREGGFSDGKQNKTDWSKMSFKREGGSKKTVERRGRTKPNGRTSWVKGCWSSGN